MSSPEKGDNQGRIPSMKEAIWRNQMEKMGIKGRYDRPTPEELTRMTAIPAIPHQVIERGQG